jgi:hypothetical protein
MRGVHHLGGLASAGASLKRAGTGARGFPAEGFELVGSISTSLVSVSAGSPVSLALPTGVSEGDLIVCAWYTDNNSTQPVTIPLGACAVLPGVDLYQGANVNAFTAVAEPGQTTIAAPIGRDYNIRCLVGAIRGPIRADRLAQTSSSGSGNLTPSDVEDGGLKNQLIVVHTGASGFSIPPEYTLMGYGDYNGRRLALCRRDATGTPGLQTQTGGITGTASRSAEIKTWVR